MTQMTTHVAWLVLRCFGTGASLADPMLPGRFRDSWLALAGGGAEASVEPQAGSQLSSSPSELEPFAYLGNYSQKRYLITTTVLPFSSSSV